MTLSFNDRVVLKVEIFELSHNVLGLILLQMSLLIITMVFFHVPIVDEAFLLKEVLLRLLFLYYYLLFWLIYLLR